MIFVIEGNHKKNISDYEKYKSERMKILKKWKTRNAEWLDAVEKEMVSYGLIISDNRRNFLKTIKQYVNKHRQRLSSVTNQIKR